MRDIRQFGCNKAETRGHQGSLAPSENLCRASDIRELALAQLLVHVPRSLVSGSDSREENALAVELSRRRVIFKNPLEKKKKNLRPNLVLRKLTLVLAALCLQDATSLTTIVRPVSSVAGLLVRGCPHAESVAFVVQERADVCRSVRVHQLTLAVSLVVPPRALVLGAVDVHIRAHAFFLRF